MNVTHCSCNVLCHRKTSCSCKREFTGFALARTGSFYGPGKWNWSKNSSLWHSTGPNRRSMRWSSFIWSIFSCFGWLFSRSFLRLWLKKHFPKKTGFLHIFDSGTFFSTKSRWNVSLRVSWGPDMLLQLGSRLHQEGMHDAPARLTLGTWERSICLHEKVMFMGKC